MTAGRAMDLGCVYERNGDAIIRVRVKASAKVESLRGERGNRLLVYVKAPPVEGKANRAVISLIAKVLKIQKGRIEITHGKRGRDKSVRIKSMSRDRTVKSLSNLI